MEYVVNLVESIIQNSSCNVNSADNDIIPTVLGIIKASVYAPRIQINVNDLMTDDVDFQTKESNDIDALPFVKPSSTVAIETMGIFHGDSEANVAAQMEIDEPVEKKVVNSPVMILTLKILIFFSSVGCQEGSSQEGGQPFGWEETPQLWNWWAPSIIVLVLSIWW